MTKDDAWNLVDMMRAYFNERSDVLDARDSQSEPDNEMRFSQGCDELLTFLEKLP